MKQSKKRNRTWFGPAIFAGLFVIMLLDSVAIRMYWHQYQEKMEIISVALGTEEELFPIFVSLWKGEDISKSIRQKGKERIEEYGYQNIRANHYGKEFIQDSRNTVILSILLFGGYLLALEGIRRSERKEMKVKLTEISGFLEQFQKRQYRVEGITYLTEEENIYEQLQSLGEMLEVLQERMEAEREETKSLVTDISHQLKTPVAALKSCFEILLNEDLNEEEKLEFSERCKKQLIGLENMVTALVNISRMETGMIQVKKEMSDIFETMVSAISRVYLKAQEKDISIEMEENSKEGEVKMTRMLIPHDVRWTCEVFINILENAIKYSPSGSVIRIRMQKRTSFLRIEIQDEGIGVLKEEYHKIFKRFYRSHLQEVQNQEGSGIGLYLVRQILTCQNGNIQVSSMRSSGLVKGNEFPGTTFIIQLPILTIL